MSDITVNLFDIVKTTDLSKTQSVIGDPDSYSNINQLIDYFLTDNILYECQRGPNNQTYANRLSYFDGYGGGSNGTNGELVSWQGGAYRYQRTGCAIFIPINRFNISTITVKAKFNAFCGWANSSSGLEWNQFKIKFARVNPEGMVFSNQILSGNYNTFRDGNYITLTGSASPAFKADYIVINVYDGAYQFTDVEITGTPEIVYTWTSVPAISGKNGISLFSMINDTDLNGGAPVQGADSSVIYRLEQSTDIGTLRQNMPFNAETPVIYVGSVDYMSIEKIGGSSGGAFIDAGTRLRFYIGGSSVPFYEITGQFYDNMYLHFIIDDENEVAKLSLINRNTNVTPITYTYNQQSFTDEEMSNMWLWLHSHVVPEDDEDETSTDLIGNDDEGGTSFKPWNNYNIPQGSNPSKGALNTGFTTMYFIDDSTLRNLSDFLWSDSFVENVKKFFSDPREIIVGLLVHPITPTYQETTSEIKAGRVSTGISAHKITNQYKTVDMGVINMHEVTHTFLDYSPFTKASVYLPYCGEHALDLSDIQNSELHLYYTFDFLTGAVCAKISVDGNFKYNFTGQCGVQIPTSSEDFSRMYSSVLSAGASLGSAIATIATGGMTAPLLIGSGANMLANGVNMTPDVQYSSGGAGSSGFISTQTPFLKIDLPVPLMANNDSSDEETESSKQYSFVGKTTYQNLKLSACAGYTKCMEVHLKGIHATDKELSQIESELLRGVIIQNGSDTPSDVPIVAGNTVITFLKCNSERNVIGKTWSTSETDIITLEGNLIYDQSVTNPKFIIEGDVIGFNYCYIPIFNRFYYINDIVVKEGLIEEISMSVDPLQSFKTDIKKCKALVERQEKKGNLYMSDSYMWTKAKREVVTVPFTAITYDYIDDNGIPSFPRSNNSYILTIAGSD